ncbi:TetR/AcrR family transcriptional regulator [Caulobacter sp. CCUG 60055]|uniref:TetR/AcrR family transcriptional regulator n=1 Tax=Caulobacter sp. CCUG 60055 TaxID=2100090 RepID=UPI001FA7B3DD|nr:TetR/AcrR family transcriptional regulator [Caulobacter sp. CCUG 60055]MCI3181841.1 TetR/AcrR family transcriptional regulator [Caulobacter sp. CCUG 60055]
MAKPAGIKARKPVQERSRRTVDAILEAAVQILEQDGEAGFTTNHVARRAGVSIGTLYQYFDGKDAILLALSERANIDIRRGGEQAASAPHGADPYRLAVRPLLAAFAGRRTARRAVLKAVLARRDAVDLGRELDAASAVAFGAGGEVDALHRFILSRALMGVVRAAVLEGSPFLDDPGLEDGLVRLLRAYRSALAAEAPAK